jgi:hypothetical protein
VDFETEDFEAFLICRRCVCLWWSRGGFWFELRSGESGAYDGDVWMGTMILFGFGDDC